MRVYHFIDNSYGMDDLKKLHLKVSILSDLNDPFELFGIDLTNQELRNKIYKAKGELSKEIGLLCFSRDWHNPVLWSHYANKHQGICLGFDIPDTNLKKVTYSDSRKRLLSKTEQSLRENRFDSMYLQELLLTKYAHWRYEDEMRWLVNLRDTIMLQNMSFVNFNDDLKLSQIIVGAESKFTRSEIYAEIQDLDVEVFKARLAFKTFRVVKLMNQKLWK